MMFGNCMVWNTRMTPITVLLFVVFGITVIYTTQFFEESFSDDSWEDKWVYSEHPGKEFGKFKLSAGKFFNDQDEDKGIQTSQDARFYAISRKFEPFSNEGKPLVIQFSVKHEQDIDCGGGYVKLFDCSLNQKDMHGETPYEIMFGPDICGVGTKKVHVIFSYKGKNLPIKKDIRCKDDVYTHFYTLIVQSDNTYEVLIDGEKVEGGKLEEDWDFLPPKKIKDPSAKKPEDWDDRTTIDDPDDKKPEDWDQPKLIADTTAAKPDDWDEELDGEWEPPKVDNPEYKGEWKPKQIDNPDYKGVWVHPEVENPEYSPDPELYKRNEICAIGFDLWQVKSGTIFGNILVSDELETAKNIVKDKWKPTNEGEKKMKEALDAEESSKADQETAVPSSKEEDDLDADEDEDMPEEEGDDEIDDNKIQDHLSDEDEGHDEL